MMRFRMYKYLFPIFLLLASLLLAEGCVKERDQMVDPSDGEMVDITLGFGTPRGVKVDVTTKSALNLAKESNVFNLYLLIFEGNGTTSKKVYGQYFDGSNLGATGESNYWTVTNMSTDSDPATSGTLHIKTAKKAGCTIVAVANMNPDDLDVSAGRLSAIKTYGELQNAVATQVRSEVAANSGYFLMIGQLDGVNIQGNTSDDDDISKKTLSLKRLYAKVTFNVRIEQGANIRSFTPVKWQIINVPTCSYLLERAAPDDAADSDGDFFDTAALGFEKETKTDSPATDYYADGKNTPVSIHSFSFYMMENRKNPIATPTGGWTGDTYKYREMQDKDPVDGSNGAFTYADAYSTYVVITGKIVMGTTVGSNANATLDANVKYKIHLGDFNSSNGNFKTERNHSYVYNIYIRSAEDIKTEVVSGNTPVENEPGATGRVVVAQEEVFNSDCHYSTHVISFHANNMDASQISWYVETPFNPKGVGPNDGVDLSQIDYKWVEFHVNGMDPSNNTYFSERRVKYTPHNWPEYEGMEPGDKRKTMYVDELVDYLASQKEQYDIDQRKMDPGNPEYVAGYEPVSDFDSDGKISVTAFVDEYYYTVHPLSGEFDPNLWKDYVVNQPMRRMHILASMAKSKDGESDLIGASFTIQQRAIQSIYAVHESADLESAWGMEFTDDVLETGAGTYWRTTAMEDCGNTSTTNGRLNTMKLWGILNPDGSDPGTAPRWEDYLDLTGTNETPHLKSAYNYLRYSCLSRNRDNNGDGFIDPEEIRWYMASDIQLIGVFLGSYGIEGDARLYQRDASDQASSDKDKWRQHVIASNRYIISADDAANSNKYPRVIWAEEGVNGSHLSAKVDNSEKTTTYSTRCVRNLGYYQDAVSGKDKDITLTEDPNVEPDEYIVTIRKHLETDGTVTSPYTGAYDNNTFYEFDCSRINLNSLREPVNHQLIGHDENSKMACLSSRFEAAPYNNLVNLDSYTAYSFNGRTYNLKQIGGLNSYLDDSFGGLDTGFSVCPEGYRIPNVREQAVMWNELSAMDTGDSDYLSPENNVQPSRTHWSKGIEGSNKVARWGWGMDSKHLLMAATTRTGNRPRCVRDL